MSTTRTVRPSLPHASRPFEVTRIAVPRPTVSQLLRLRGVRR